jgi:transcriptional regulator with XRE-family HTH domain
MHGLGKRLRERAQHLGLSDAEVARRAGLSERRYANYIADSREPDFATFLRICAVLELEPTELLLPRERKTSRRTARDRLLSRLSATARLLTDADLSIAVDQVSALLRGRGHRT